MAAYAVEGGYRTQKARGVAALKDTGYNTPSFEVYGIERFTDENVSLTQILLNRFVRPCPIRPRHGFVDSRPIHTIEDAIKIVKETVAVEPEAELLVMPFINAEFSGIWTDGLLAVGKGNDGATAGHSSRNIPIIGYPSTPATSRFDWNSALQSGGITEAPYLELLWKPSESTAHMYTNYFVQLRNGPKLPATVDFIPASIEVKNVVLAEGDLLEWETKIKTFAAGTVIYHPNGSLASHYAVHAVLNNVPVMVSREPEIGETLVPNAETPNPDITKIRAGFLLGATLEMDYKTAAYAMLVACHSTALWLGKQDALLGFGMGCAYRLTLAAALGEMRHHRERKRCPDRDSVYLRVWDRVLDNATRTRYIAALDSFYNDNWRTSFGGRKWYEFTKWAGEIYNMLIDGNVPASLEALNQLVHAAHNGGWGFDKFLSKRELDVTAVNPLVTALKCAPYLYKAIVTVEEKPELTKWFTSRKHYTLEPLDQEGAKKQIEREEESAPEKDTCGNCGEPYSCCEDCHHCDPPDDPEIEQASCDSDNGCGEESCTVCNPNGITTHAQAKLIDEGGDVILHVQYKRVVAGKQGYETKNVHLSGAQVDRVRKIFAAKPPTSDSWCNGSKVKYLTMMPSGDYAKSWFICAHVDYVWTPFYVELP
jgi:hypothetical protein